MLSIFCRRTSRQLGIDDVEVPLAGLRVDALRDDIDVATDPLDRMLEADVLRMTRRRLRFLWVTRLISSRAAQNRADSPGYPNGAWGAARAAEVVAI